MNKFSRVSLLNFVRNFVTNSDAALAQSTAAAIRNLGFDELINFEDHNRFNQSEQYQID